MQFDAEKRHIGEGETIIVKVSAQVCVLLIVLFSAHQVELAFDAEKMCPGEENTRCENGPWIYYCFVFCPPGRVGI